MCTPACATFVSTHLAAHEAGGKRILEVGALDPLAVIRGLVVPLQPSVYMGVDMTPGPGVDVLCPAEQLLARFGARSFDVVITTEMLEHCRDWRLVVHNLKGVLDVGGLLLLTTRSRGMEFHPAPLDFWRFEPDDMTRIFGDLEIEALDPDPEPPGVFIRARRPERFRERDVSLYDMYSIVRRRRAKAVTFWDVAGAHCLATGTTLTARLLPLRVRHALRRAIVRVAPVPQQGGH